MRDRKFILAIILSGFIGASFALIGNKFLSGTEMQIVSKNDNFSAKQVSNVDKNYPFNFTEAAEKGKNCVVHIRAEESEQQVKNRISRDRRSGGFWSLGNGLFDYGFGPQLRGMSGGGSGVIYTSDGYIITNNHVVDFADNILVTLSDNKEYKARKIGTDPSSDLAVIKIEETNLPVLELANSDEARLGQWVLAIGNPFDFLTSSVTAGIVSAIGRDINIISDQRALEEFIQTDAAVNPGNSGGALVDANGKLLGITSAIASPTGSYAGYSFAIPTNLMKKVVDKIIEKGGNLDSKPSLGISAATVDNESKEVYDIKADSGIYVVEVEDGSSAKASGILPGDVITKVNDTEIEKFEDLFKVLNLANVGDLLNIQVLRNNKSKNIVVKLKQSL